MSFLNLVIEPAYNSLINNVVDDFYTPILNESILYERAVGFFSSSALIEISKGIDGLVKNGGSIHIVASPRLSEEDVEAIKHGLELREKIVEQCLLKELKNPQNKFEEERLNYLSNLIADGILDIKIAFLKNFNDVAMFHIKSGLMHDAEGNHIAFTGSMNESATAFSHNYESIDVYKSWADNGQIISEFDIKRIEIKQLEFLNLWENCQPKVEVKEFTAVKDEIVKKYLKEKIINYSTVDCSNRGEHNNYGDNSDEKLRQQSLLNAPHVPKNLVVRNYQKEAVRNWVNNGYRGIFDMATGTGKTYTALVAVAELFKNNNNRLAVIIVCPYQHLVEQWVEDIKNFGMRPIVCHSASKQKDWKNRLRDEIDLYNGKLSNQFCCVVTNASFSGNFFGSQISKLSDDTLIVVDEAHNFGAKHLQKTLPHNIPYRLALSATITRHNDEYGTQVLLNYFGAKCIEYTLKDAIENNMLTPYYYYPIVVSLTDEELEEYLGITEEIGRAMARCKKKNGKIIISERVEMLLLKRAKVVAGASNKLSKLREEIQTYRDDKHMLVYCGATTLRDIEYKEGQPPVDEIKQINAVVDILGNELDMKVSKFTSEESAEERGLLKEAFNDGSMIQALIAIRCLDEGVNIPSIDKAFILASSSNPKEYIQRRGRVLRLFPGKKYSKIYDFVTVPIDFELLGTLPEHTRNSLKSLVRKEVERMVDFASIAENPSETDFLVADLKRAYDITDRREGNDEW